MALMKVLGLLAIAASTIASPAGIEPADETVTVTVTTTAVSLVTVVPPPPAPTSVPPVTTTILRTRTATTWTRTTTVVSPLNCTRTVLLAPPRITTSRAPPPRITLSLLGRQANSSSSVVPTGRSTFPPPPPFPPARTSTRTVFTTTTATQTGDLRRTRFECGTTVTLLYTVDVTTTFTITATSYPNVVTSTSTIPCLLPGRPGLPTGGGTTTRLPLPTSVTGRIPPPPPLPTTTLRVPSLERRQIAITNSTSAALPTAAVTSLLGNGTITVHLTSTVYSFTTRISNATTTVVGWACSPFSTTLVIGTTISRPIPSTTLLPPPPPVTTSVSVLPPPIPSTTLLTLIPPTVPPRPTGSLPSIGTSVSVLPSLTSVASPSVSVSSVFPTVSVPPSYILPSPISTSLVLTLSSLTLPAPSSVLPTVPVPSQPVPSLTLSVPA